MVFSLGALDTTNTNFEVDDCAMPLLATNPPHHCSTTGEGTSCANRTSTSPPSSPALSVSGRQSTRPQHAARCVSVAKPGTVKAKTIPSMITEVTTATSLPPTPPQ